MEPIIEQFKNTIIAKIAELQALVPPPTADIEILTILLEGLPNANV